MCSRQVSVSPSLVPRPPSFQFAFNTRKRKSAKNLPVFRTLPLPCIILNANQRTKNGSAWERGAIWLAPSLVSVSEMLFSVYSFSTSSSFLYWALVSVFIHGTFSYLAMDTHS